MKIAFVIQKLSHLSGGAERVLCSLASQFSALENEVSVYSYERVASAPFYDLGKARHINLCKFRENPSTERLQSKTSPRYGLEKIYKSVPNIAPFTHLKWRLTYQKFIDALSKEFETNRPDLVIGFMPTGIMVSSLSALPLSVPVVGTIHNVPKLDYFDQTRWDRNPIYRKKRLKALFRCSLITVLQEEFIEQLPADLRSKTYVMPNPVELHQGPSEPDATRENIILGVGRLAPIKQYDLLLRSFAGIVEKHPHWSVEICGEGAEKERLRALARELGIEKNVVFSGKIDGLAPHYQRAKIFAHPSRFEGFGLVVAEALSHGLPCVALESCSGVNKMIADGENGFLTEANIDAYANALNALMSDTALRVRLGQSAPDSVKQYASDEVLKAWKRLLSRIGLELSERI